MIYAYTKLQYISPKSQPLFIQISIKGIFVGKNMEEQNKKIAVVMIVKNEEALLARCLESVKEADAIYILDTGSVDNTIEIARKYTDNVDLGHIWIDDFQASQNYAKRNVKEDWILSIDADEYLDCPFSEVRKAVALGKDYIRCFMRAEGGQRLDFGFSRLFRNSPDIYWCQKIHKHLNLGGAGEEVGNVRIVFGFSPAHLRDPDRALRVLEQVVLADGDDAGRNFYYLGREYWYKQRYQEAIDMLNKHVRSSNWDAERAESFFIMSQAYTELKNEEMAQVSCLEAIKLNANFKEAIMWMASISTPENAKQWRRMARTANNNDVLWDRMPAEPIKDVIFLSPHNDDECLFGAYTLMRLRPLVIVVTDSYIQPNRGDVGCGADVRRQETIDAMNLLGCPVLFMGIKDTELTEDVLRERLRLLNPETIYIPALQGGNSQHDLVNKVALEVFGKAKCEQYTTYTKTELYTEGGWEVKPSHTEMELKNKALECYKSQLALPSTKPHFEAVKGKSEWLV
jgi:glycosyltransferase involved in cell wall biosynthesis/LmbE family N-acetylglucosaminyl deacetylase